MLWRPFARAPWAGSGLPQAAQSSHAGRGVVAWLSLSGCSSQATTGEVVAPSGLELSAEARCPRWQVIPNISIGPARRE